MTALDEITKDSNWDYEEQCMDGAPLGYAEVYYVGDPVFAQAKLELSALREAGEKMAVVLRYEMNEGTLTDEQTMTALEAWEAANK